MHSHQHEPEMAARHTRPFAAVRATLAVACIRIVRSAAAGDSVQPFRAKSGFVLSTVAEPTSGHAASENGVDISVSLPPSATVPPGSRVLTIRSRDQSCRFDHDRGFDKVVITRGTPNHAPRAAKKVAVPPLVTRASGALAGSSEIDRKSLNHCSKCAVKRRAVQGAGALENRLPA